MKSRYTWERPRKTESLAKMAETLRLNNIFKDKRECWGVGVGNSKGRKAIHMETEKHTFDKHVSAGPAETRGTEGILTLCRSLPVYTLGSY